MEGEKKRKKNEFESIEHLAQELCVHLFPQNIVIFIRRHVVHLREI